MSTRPEPRADLKALSGYHSPQVDVAVRLNTNESPYGPPAAFVTRWLDALRSVEWNRYPDRGATELRDALGSFLDQPAERILCGNGSNEVLQTLLLTYGGAGRAALMFEPTYALHAQLARGTGTTVVAGERAAGYVIDPDDARATIERTQPAIVFVCSPNNPTGTVEPETTIRMILDAAEGVGALVIVDEAYGEFAPWSALSLVDDERPLAVVRTYSKIWSLAGVRLGFTVAPEWMIAELEKVLLPYNLSVPTQVAGTIALEFRREMEQRVATLVEERGRVFAALAGTDGVEVSPSGANFLLFRVDGDAHALWKALLAQDVLVRDFSSWPRVEGCLRVTIGTPEENDRFLAALREALPEVRA
ncbi:MAG TPA: histidinol-phosphate transaminase [Acidimicrobiia bacterium]|nr:histidinol-phosphate transaminase [Acidimicrobiia bacterium]